MIKKVIINIILVVITVFVIDFLISRVLDHYYYKSVNGENYRTTYVMEESLDDILIFGSSQAKYSYIPTIFEDSLGLTCYNAGKDRSVLLYQNAVLKSVLKRYVPKLIIMDYSGGKFEEETAYDMLSSLGPYHSKHPEIRGILELKSPFEKLKLQLKTYRYNSEVYKIFRNTTYSKKRKTVKGYVAQYGEWQKKMDTIDFEAYKADSVVLKANRDFINLVKVSGSKIVVVVPPVYENYERKQEKDFIDQLCQELDVPLFDFSKNSLFLNNRKYFVDPLHLNHDGALVFTNLVVEELKNQKIID